MNTVRNDVTGQHAGVSWLERCTDDDALRPEHAGVEPDTLRDPEADAATATSHFALPDLLHQRRRDHPVGRLATFEHHGGGGFGACEVREATIVDAGDQHPVEQVTELLVPVLLSDALLPRPREQRIFLGHGEQVVIERALDMGAEVLVTIAVPKQPTVPLPRFRDRRRRG